MAVAPPQVNSRESAIFVDIFGDPSRHFTSGDYIHGTVRIDPNSRPHRVTLAFTGTSLLYDVNASHIKIDLFKYSRDLFKSSHSENGLDIWRRGTAEDGKVELPFEFTFPHTVELPPPPDREWWHYQDEFNHPRFQHSPGFPLPPSYTLSRFGSGPLELGPIVADPQAVYVRYYLEARVESSSVDSSNTKLSSARQGLRFVPAAPQYDASLLLPLTDFGTNIPKQFCRYKLIRTRNLLPDYETSSKRGKVKDFLIEKELFFGLNSYSEVPFVRFSIFAIPARIITIGADFPIKINLEHFERSKSIPEPPKIFLRRIKVQITSNFNVFIPQTTKPGRLTKNEETHTVSKKITLVDKKFSSDDKELLSDKMNLTDIAGVQLAIADDDFIPSFTSYGLTLEHEVQVYIWGECAKHEFEALGCRERIQIVSGWTVDVPPPPIEEESSGPSRRFGVSDSEVPPPPYVA